jgi:hypothetical protein
VLQYPIKISFTHAPVNFNDHCNKFDASGARLSPRGTEKHFSLGVWEMFTIPRLLPDMNVSECICPQDSKPDAIACFRGIAAAAYGTQSFSAMREQIFGAPVNCASIGDMWKEHGNELSCNTPGIYEPLPHDHQSTYGIPPKPYKRPALSFSRLANEQKKDPKLKLNHLRLQERIIVPLAKESSK